MYKKKWVFYLLFFAVLLAGFYLAIMDERPFHQAPLTVINPDIPDFNFIDQDGKSFSNKQTEGKIYVAEYFFTTCKGICPKMNANMRRVFDEFKDNKDFMILSHTCMPEVDSVHILKKYEQRMLGSTLRQRHDGSYELIADTTGKKITTATNWKFLTGSKKELYQMARQGYMIDNGKPDSLQIEQQFIHTQFFALVDRYGRVRGIYDGLVEGELQKLLSDIPKLMEEKIESAHFVNGFSNTPN